MKFKKPRDHFKWSQKRQSNQYTTLAKEINPIQYVTQSHTLNPTKHPPILVPIKFTYNTSNDIAFTKSQIIKKIPEAYNSQAWFYKELIKGLHTCVVKNISPGDGYLSLWEAAAINQISIFSTRSLAFSLYNLALLDISEMADFRKIAMSKLRLKEINIAGANQLWLSHLYYKHTLLNAEQECYIGSMLDEATSVRGFRSSTSEKLFVTSLLRYLDDRYELNTLKIQSQKYLKKLYTSTDCMIKYRDKIILVEYDGPWHFKQTYDGQFIKTPSTKLMTKLLKQEYQCEVLRTKYFQWEKLKTDLERDEYFDSKIGCLLDEYMDSADQTSYTLSAEESYPDRSPEQGEENISLMGESYSHIS